MKPSAFSHQLSAKKIQTPAALAAILASARSKAKRIVFSNGCFDLLHAGHVTYLKKARDLGDILVVGLNSDSSVCALKGKGRPVNNERDRALVLSALYFVDYITVFSDDTPEKLIRKLKPDILVKGGDWAGREIAGAKFIKSIGGRVVMISFVKGYSTTSILNKIRK